MDSNLSSSPGGTKTLSDTSNFCSENRTLCHTSMRSHFLTVIEGEVTSSSVLNNVSFFLFDQHSLTDFQVSWFVMILHERTYVLKLETSA